MKHFLLIVMVMFCTSCTQFMAITTDGPIEEDYGERTMGTVLEDSTIESKAKINIQRASETLANANINVHSYNRILLITGQVPDAASKQLATQVAEQIRHVRRVHNELEVSGPTAFLSRSNDVLLATKIKTRFIATNDVDSSRVDFVVENGTVYLMGLVTAAEAERIVAAVKEVSGIQKIVKVFEYIPEQTK